MGAALFDCFSEGLLPRVIKTDDYFVRVLVPGIYFFREIFVLKTRFGAETDPKETQIIQLNIVAPRVCILFFGVSQISTDSFFSQVAP